MPQTEMTRTLSAFVCVCERESERERKWRRENKRLSERGREVEREGRS